MICFLLFSKHKTLKSYFIYVEIKTEKLRIFSSNTQLQSDCTRKKSTNYTPLFSSQTRCLDGDTCIILSSPQILPNHRLAQCRFHCTQTVTDRQS